MLRSACGLLLPSLVLAFGSTPTMLRSACGLLLPPLVLAFGSTPTAQRGFILAGGMGQPYGTPDRNLLLVSDGIGGPFSVVTNASGRRLQRQGRGLLDPSLDRVGRLLPSAAAPLNVPSREKIAGESGFGNTFALVAGDFNMDGVDDVVIGNADAYNDEGELPSANQILFGCKNDPDCVFHWTFSLPAGSNPPGFTERNTRGLAACDVDLDGSLDIIVANYDTYNNGMGSQVLRNTGEPPSGFDAEDLLTNNKPDFMGFLHLAIACGDLNDDGYPDIVVGSQMAPNEILLNDGTGHFPEATTFASDAEGASLTTALSIGDVNNDGRPDIVVGNGGYEPTPSFVYLNEGEARFGDGVPLPSSGSGRSTAALALCDVDADGSLDVLLGNDNAPNTLLRGDGTGAFEPEDLPGVAGTFTAALIAADINGDGRCDVVLGNDAGDPELLTNSGGSFTASILPGGKGADEHTMAIAAGKLEAAA